VDPTFTVNKITDWKVGGYKEYVDEAKRQGYNCKAIVALAAEKKRESYRSVERRVKRMIAGRVKYYMKWVNRLSDCSSTSHSAYNYEFRNNLLYVVGRRVDVKRLGDYQITDNSIYLGVDSRFYSTGVYIGLAKNQESQTNKKWQFKHIRQNKKTYNTETNYEYLYLCK
jgi:hypothetical protein